MAVRSQPNWPTSKVHRTAEHLKENKVESYKIAVGPSLELDSVAETFKGNEKANTMLTREYRKGYEIPSASGI